MRRLGVAIFAVLTVIGLLGCSNESNIDKRENALIRDGYPTDAEQSCMTMRNLFGKEAHPSGSFCTAEIDSYRNRVAFMSVDRGWGGSR